MKSGGPSYQIHFPHLHVGASGIFSDLLKSVQILKRDWGAESYGKLQHLFIPSKTVTFVPDFAVEDLKLSRTAALVCSERPALGQNTLLMMLMTCIIIKNITLTKMENKF